MKLLSLIWLATMNVFILVAIVWIVRALRLTDPQLRRVKRLQDVGWSASVYLRRGDDIARIDSAGNVEVLSVGDLVDVNQVQQSLNTWEE